MNWGLRNFLSSSKVLISIFSIGFIFSIFLLSLLNSLCLFFLFLIIGILLIEFDFLSSYSSFFLTFLIWSLYWNLTLNDSWIFLLFPILLGLKGFVHFLILYWDQLIVFSFINYSFDSSSSFFIPPFQYFFLLFSSFFFKAPIHCSEVYNGFSSCYSLYHIHYFSSSQLILSLFLIFSFVLLIFSFILLFLF